jgi:hypothetical protein
MFVFSLMRGQQVNRKLQQIRFAMENGKGIIGAPNFAVSNQGGLADGIILGQPEE